ncbi:hypothetical protein T8T21_05735 [Limimaricola variabilis]|uniref:hypothetical protein n=1 Tax=Limimaricola variabilis TaxID=1492771 RepID=UPI002AC9B5B3|nr:hypothetical protein [Limimaricola variabilis]WPY95622.1 hypothetical protein T8T21_05735 [Limimaricola variabilis]
MSDQDLDVLALRAGQACYALIRTKPARPELDARLGSAALNRGLAYAIAPGGLGPAQSSLRCLAEVFIADLYSPRHDLDPFDATS